MYPPKIMSPEILNNLKSALRSIEELIVNGHYEDISTEAGKSRLTVEEMKTAIETYPGSGKPTLAPLSELDKIQPVEITGVSEKSWAIDYDLWFDDQPSDLTLQLKATLDENNDLKVTVEDIHIL